MTHTPLRIVFMGTPQFAVPCLEAILKFPDRFQMVGVVSQPDRPAGRGQKLQSPEVKILADQHQIPVIQPERLGDQGPAADQVRAWAPDVIVVVAFGQLLKPAILAIPRFGCINVHGSLLPRWRGAAPIQWAIWSGDQESGVCTMLMEQGLDTGPVIDVDRMPLNSQTTTASLFSDLSTLGAATLIKTLDRIHASHSIPPSTPQDQTLVTIARKLKKDDGMVNPNLHSATEIHRQIRALDFWPGCRLSDGELSAGWNASHIKLTSFKIRSTQLADRADALRFKHLVKGDSGSGILAIVDGRLFLTCRDSTLLEITEWQQDGKKSVRASEWIRGLSAGELRDGPIARIQPRT